MARLKRILILVSFVAGLLICMAYLNGFGVAAAFSNAISKPINPPIHILAWNDPGMHCICPDFSKFVSLPPNNNLLVQGFHVGIAPKLITSSLEGIYLFNNNNHIVGKTDIKIDVQQSVIVNALLPDNAALEGKDLSGTMRLVNDRFYCQSDPTNRVLQERYDPSQPMPFCHAHSGKLGFPDSFGPAQSRCPCFIIISQR